MRSETIFGSWKPLKIDQKFYFYFMLKALFVLKIFKFLSWSFGHVEKTVWLEGEGLFQNLWLTSLLTNNYKNTYCPISHEIKAIRQLDLVI